ncbi:MAG TPA: FAD-dependent oxidoreductase [Ktedonobacteraceae bacterium]|jgi:glycine oxidase
MHRFVDTVIIGGGVIGCAIAYYLSRQGRTVEVIERGEIGSQASGAAAGLLAPLGPLSGPGPFADLLLAGFALWPSTAAELQEASGLHLGYEQTGALRIVRNPKRIPHLKKRFANWQSLGLQMHWLDGDEARQIEPGLTPEVSAAIYAPEEAQIQAQQVVQAYAQAAQRLGAMLHTHTEVTGIEQSHNRVTAVCVTPAASPGRKNPDKNVFGNLEGGEFQTGPSTSKPPTREVSTSGMSEPVETSLVGGFPGANESIACEHLVLATGAWAAQADEWFHLQLPVRPLRGQMLALPQPQPSLRTIVFGDAAYLIPRGTRILVGATKEESGFEVRTTIEGQRWLQSTATRLVPILQSQQPIMTWAGLRPHTPDAHPIIGSAPGWENLFLAIGHASVGVLLSALTGQAIAELIASGQLPELIRPFTLERFASTQKAANQENMLPGSR